MAGNYALGAPVSAGFAPQNLDAPAAAPPLQRGKFGSPPPQTKPMPKRAPASQTKRPSMKRGQSRKQMGQSKSLSKGRC